MTADKRQADQRLAAAKQPCEPRLVENLESAHRAGMLKQVNPDVKPVTNTVRVKADRP